MWLYHLGDETTLSMQSVPAVHRKTIDAFAEDFMSLAPQISKWKIHHVERDGGTRGGNDHNTHPHIGRGKNIFQSQTKDPTG